MRESARAGFLTQAGGHLWAWRYGLGRGRRVVGLRSAAGQQLVSGGQEVGEGGVGPGGVVVVVVVGPGGTGGVGATAVVEAAEDVEALAVDVEVEDHHDDEVHQAQEQHALADPLQGPAQHQPGHGRGRGRCSATGIRQASNPCQSHGPRLDKVTYRDTQIVDFNQVDLGSG